MKNAYINGLSEPKINSNYPPAEIYLYNRNFIDNKNVIQLNYAGGGVIAPLCEYPTFMKAMVNHKLVKKKQYRR